MNKGELLKKYNEIFNAKEEVEIDIKRKVGVLEIIFKALEDSLYSSTDEYQVLVGEYVEKSDKLINTLTEEQVELFEECHDLFQEMNSKIEFQLFVFGYLLADNLK